MHIVYAVQRALGLQGFYLMLLGVLLVVLVVVRVLRSRGSSVGASALAWTGLLVAVAVVLEATLSPTVDPGTAVPRLILDPVAGAQGWAGVAWRPVVNNVGLFVPLGAMAGTAMPRASRWALLVLLVLVSIGIETTQYLLPLGRVANSADVLANGAGAGLGLLLATLVLGGAAHRRAPERVAAGR